MEQTVETRSEVEQTSSTLHGIAECLLVGPQHRATGEIAPRTTADGFALTAGPHRELDGLGLVNDGSDDFNVAFGAVRDATDLTSAANLLAFWREGLARTAADRAGSEA